MPSTIADVAQEKVHCYNVGALSGTIPSIMTERLRMLCTLENLPLPFVPQTDCLHGAGGFECRKLEDSEMHVRRIASAPLPGRFQIGEPSRHALFLMSRIMRYARISHRAYESALTTGAGSADVRYEPGLAMPVDDWHCAIEGPATGRTTV